MIGTVVFAEEVFAPNASKVCSAAYSRSRGLSFSLYAGCAINLNYIDMTTSISEGGEFSVWSGGIAPTEGASVSQGCTFNLISLAHAIKEAQYFDMPQQLNRIYVIGVDDMGNPIYGESVDDTAIAVYGERLRVYPEPMLSNKTMTKAVAQNILDGVRLLDQRGIITIPPNIGMELWDVVAINDTTCNQENAVYRVSGYRLQYEAKTGTFLHHVMLTGV